MRFCKLCIWVDFVCQAWNTISKGWRGMLVATSRLVTRVLPERPDILRSILVPQPATYSSFYTIKRSILELSTPALSLCWLPWFLLDARHVVFFRGTFLSSNLLGCMELPRLHAHQCSETSGLERWKMKTWSETLTEWFGHFISATLRNQPSPAAEFMQKLWDIADRWVCCGFCDRLRNTCWTFRPKSIFGFAFTYFIQTLRRCDRCTFVFFPCAPSLFEAMVCVPKTIKLHCCSPKLVSNGPNCTQQTRKFWVESQFTWQTLEGMTRSQMTVGFALEHFNIIEHIQLQSATSTITVTQPNREKV